MKTGSTTFVSGLSILIISLTLIILDNYSGTFVFLIPVATSISCGGLMFIISGLFENRQYYKTTIYLVISGAILAVTLVLIYMQVSALTSQYYQILYSIIIGTLIANLAFIYGFARKLRTHETTINLYNKTLKTSPHDTTALNNKGTALSDIKEYAQAMECFDKVIEIDPQDAAAWHNKGVVLEKTGKHREAIEYYDKALKADPGFQRAKNSGKIILEA